MASSVASSGQETSSEANKLNSDPTNPSSAKESSDIKSADKKAAGVDVDKNPDANLTKEEKLKRFENEGVQFKAKLIGSELVMEPRGDKMCQSSIQRLKAMVKGLKSHKKRILLKISYNGVKVYDEKTNEILHHHEVPQISYIASDDTDSRTFGYVCDLPNKGHQFICFKTGGPAITVMSTISSLFEAVLEKKNDAEKALRIKAKRQQEEHLAINLKSPTSTTTPATSHSIDLVGDSGIMDNDLSFSSDFNFSKQQQHHQLHQQRSGTGSQLFGDSILTFASGGGGVDSSLSENIFSDGPGSAWPSGNQNNNNNNSSSSGIQSQMNQRQLHSQQQLYQRDQQQNLSQQQQHLQQQLQQQQNLYEKQQSFQQQPQQQHSGAASADLLFSDLFFGLSDPIIVGQNDSLVSSRMPLDGAIGATASLQQQQQHQQHLQQPQQQQLSSTSGSPAQLRSQINSGLSSSQSQRQHQHQQQQMMMMHQQRMMNSSNNNNSISSSNINNNPFDANSSMNSNQLSNSGASIMRPRPTPTMQAPQPIPPRIGLNRQSTLNVPNNSGVMSPLSLPRPGPMMQEPALRHNRSLVHNHSSVSLSDAALTRQFSFNTSPSNQQPISESYADRYSVFNDIDNLPSIFESASLGNVNSNQDAATMGGRQAIPNSRMSNIQRGQTGRSSNFNFNF